MRRSKITRRNSKSYFRRGANRVHVKNNLRAQPMRGGIRL